KEEFKELTGFGFYSVLDQGAGILVNRIDVLMIGALVGLSEVVYYQMAFFMITVITIPSRALSNVSSAVTSESMHKEDWTGIRKLFFSNGLIQTLVGGWIFILIWCNLDLVLMMLPPEFSVIRWPLFFLGVSKMFDLFTSINGLIIGFSPFFRYNFYFNILLLVITIIANLLLIPYYGITGAAIATAFSLLLYNLMKSIFLYRKYGIQPITIPGLLLLAALFISAIIGLAIPDFISVDMNLGLFQRTIPVLINIGIRTIIISGSLYAFVYLFGVNRSIREIVPEKFQRFL
ncbi:MAG TPA: polysaccharide biosynthesis C-terminal domain-containing protein, partial [Flavobacteriales bacterium]|nr:polysaccharide biosynthesis C-terminal domain-containing protein [Flavobacteriales bacterium]